MIIKSKPRKRVLNLKKKKSNLTRLRSANNLRILMKLWEEIYQFRQVHRMQRKIAKIKSILLNCYKAILLDKVKFIKLLVCLT